MNMIPSTCSKCGINILVKQKLLHLSSARICVTCVANMAAMDDDNDEFGIPDDEEDELYNDFDYLDDSEDVDWDAALRQLKELQIPEEPTCECGAIKADIPWHSDWCPLRKHGGA